jgi:hypothetical protein
VERKVLNTDPREGHSDRLERSPAAQKLTFFLQQPSDGNGIRRNPFKGSLDKESLDKLPAYAAVADG